MRRRGGRVAAIPHLVTAAGGRQQPGAVIGGGTMQKMLPLQKNLAGFRKAVVEPPWRAAFNAAISTRGRCAQNAG